MADLVRKEKEKKISYHRIIEQVGQGGTCPAGKRRNSIVIGKTITL